MTRLRLRELNDYQAKAISTLLPSGNRIDYLSLGLCGEAGEVAEKVKKHIRDGHKLDRNAVAKELGDVLWYVANLSALLGFELSQVAQINVDKLEDRQNRDKLGGSGDDR